MSAEKGYAINDEGGETTDRRDQEPSQTAKILDNKGISVEEAFT